LYVDGDSHVCGTKKDTANTVSSPGQKAFESGETPRADSDDLVGTIIGERFDVLERLSAGGMGVVYRARHILLDAEVAIKVLLKPQDEEAQYRFLQEAQLACKVKHPNTVIVSDFGVLPDGRSYLVMEFLRGPTLSKVISQGPVPPERMCKIALQIANGLQAVHHQGIIHRDLKPDNIFLVDRAGGEDVVKIVDFGIATNRGTSARVNLTELAPEQMTDEMRRALKERHTLPGMVLGTPQYMSPEQTQGFELDHRTDQYALGCIMYEMLTGIVPFDDASFMAVMFAHASKPVPPMRTRLPSLQISPGLEEIVMRTLAKAPDARFPSMKELEAALQTELDALSPNKKPSQVQIQVVKKGWPLWALIATVWGTLLVVGVGALSGYAIYKRRQQAAHDDSLAATTRLLEAREQATEVLKRDLSATTVELRVGALSGLAETHNATLLPALVPLLKDADLRVQVKTAEILGQLGRREATAQLLPLVTAQNIPPVLQEAAAEALDQLGELRGRQLLKSMMSGKGDQQAKLRATLYLGGTGDVDARKVLTQAVKQGHVSLAGQLEVLPLLARVGDEDALEQLRVRLGGGGNVEQQRQVAKALARLSEPSGKQFLREQSKKPGLDGLMAQVMLAQLDETVDLEMFRNVMNAPAATTSMLVLAVTGLGYAGQRADIDLLLPRLTPKEPQLQQAAATAIIRLTGADPQVLAMQDVGLAERALLGGGGLLPEEALAILGEVGTGKQVGTLHRALQSGGDVATRRGAAKALGKIRDRAALTALVTGLEDKETAVREEVIRALGEAGRRLAAQGQKDVVAEVRGLLNKVVSGAPSQEQALAAATLLKLGDETQRNAVTQAMRDGKPDTRRQLLSVLEKDTATLVAALSDADEQIRFLSARHLAELRDKRAVPVLEQLLKEKPDTSVGVLAYSLLRKLNVEVEAPKKTAEFLDSDDPAVRAAAVQAAAQEGSEATLLLERAARDPDKQVRLSAATETGRLPEPEARALLKTLMRDRDPEVRAKATATYQQLKAAEKEAASKTGADKPATEAKPGETKTDEKTPTKTDAPTEKTPAQEVIEKLVRAGATLFKEGSHDKARAKLQQANALCAREPANVCRPFAWDLGYHLGRCFEGDARFEQAMTEYQKLKTVRSLSRTQRKDLGQATARVQNKLALVTVVRNKRGQCVPEDRWLAPGSHEIQIKGSAAVSVEVRARQKKTVKEPGCP
jgi:HEAT repeat protein